MVIRVSNGGKVVGRLRLAVINYGRNEAIEVSLGRKDGNDE